MSTFNPPADIAQITLAKSSDVNAVKAATAIAFALLPSETKLQRGTVNFAVDTGTANSYVVTLDASITSYTDGLQVVFRPLNSNTGTATINLNGLGAKSIVLTNSDPISAGDISAGAVIDARYSTATGFFHLTPNSAIYAHNAALSAQAATDNGAIQVGLAADQVQLAADQVDLAAGQVLLAQNKANDALGYLNTFKGQYYGALSANPTLDPLGAAMTAGDLYWNTTSSEMRVYSGSAWITAYLPSSGYLTLSGGTMTGLINFADGQTFPLGSSHYFIGQI